MMQNDLGRFLEKLRGNKSLRKVADESGLSHSYIRDLELGVNRKTNAPIRPTPDTLKKIAKVYDHPYGKLMIAAGYFDEDIEDIIISDTSIEEQVFFKEFEKLSEEDKKKALEHIKFLRHLAEQENNK
jgi:transcriptional regulator with XRE-family HTH domain